MLLLLCTILHFSVDGLCGAVLADYAVNESDFEKIIFYFGLYTSIAFGLQWLAGLILDKRKNFILPALGVVPLFFAGGLFTSLGIFRQSILIAIGNCLFHVSAGILILTKSKNFREPGIFVSSGAIGLGLGLAQIINAEIFEITCIIFTIIVLFLAKNFEYKRVIKIDSPKSKMLFAGAIMLLACVILRGFGGNSEIQEYIMLMPCVFALGKSFGGIFCDLIGWRKTILIIFVTSFFALQLTGNFKIIILAFAFNMTMPLTLRLLYCYFPDYPGLNFGLAAGCLMPGYFLHEYFSVSPYIMTVIQFLSLFFAGLIYSQGRDEKFLQRS